MKIAINASRAINEKAGVGRVADKLIQNLLEIDSKDQYLLLFNFFRNREIKNQAAMVFIRPNSQIKISHWPGGLQEYWFSCNIPKSLAADVYLAPTFLDFQIGLNIPQVVIIHDLTNFTHPEHAGQEISERYQQKTRQAAQKAAQIITVSESTKQDVIKILKVDPSKIKVVYPGNTKFPSGGKIPQYLTPNCYLLFVGTIEPRKNLIGLLRAYSLLPTALRKKYPLVIVGGKGWNNNRELQEIGQTPGVKWLGYVSDADLGALYKNAKVFAFPSLYEGFGIPVIEAQQFGVPVITSNISSLPEACGEGGVLIGPEDPEDIATALEKILTNEKLYQNLSRKALDNSQKFSWTKSAEKTLEVLRLAQNS